MVSKDFTPNLVSVVIPTYKRRNATARAIESCLAQSHKEIEIIVVNDDLEDPEFTQLKADFSDESRVAFFSVLHTGHPGKVRNVGLGFSKGEWIAFLDSDDYWAPEKIELQLDFLARMQLDAACSNAFIAGTQNMLLTDNVPSEITLSRLLRENLIVNSSVLIKKSLLDSVGGVVESGSVLGSEDYATWLRVSEKTSWVYSAKGLVHYESNSVDSLKYSREVSQMFSKIQGLLNFIEWKKSQGRSLKASRLVLYLLPKVVRCELSLIQAIRQGKESNQ
jgi:glycosyltransferase involved in cell wall biosynthesis